MPIKLHQIQ